MIDSIRRHAAFTPTEATLIGQACKLRSYSKDSWLVIPGEVCAHAIFILDGCVKTYFADLNGQEHIIQPGNSGWWGRDLRSFCHQVSGR